MKTLPAILPCLLCLPLTSVALAQETAPPLTTSATTPASTSSEGATPTAPVAPPATAPQAAAVPATAPAPPVSSAIVGNDSPSASPAPVAGTPVADTAVEDTAPHHRVHEGFYLSASLGGGARAATILSNDKITVDGTGAGVSFHIGGAVAPNLIVHGTVATSVAEDPEFSVGSMTVVADNARLVFAAAGPGATYYVMPANLYVGASVLMAQTSIEIDDEVVAKTEWGPGVLLRAGKDFWVAERMLMGIGLELFAANMSDQNTTDEVTARAFNLVMNVGYD